MIHCENCRFWVYGYCIGLRRETYDRYGCEAGEKKIIRRCKMPKIRVEIEVPNDVFRPCETCRYYRQDRFDWGYCYLFEQKISYGHRCDECKQAEVEE